MRSKKNRKSRQADDAPAAAAEEVPVQEQPADDGKKEVTVEEALEEALAEAQAANDRFLRAKAELENLRKKNQRDLTDARQYTKGVTIGEFFGPFDHFQMAMAHIEDSPDVETMKQGMKMILAEFQRGFENLGVTLIDATGQTFNPEEHEAVAQETSDTVPEGTVIRQWKCGYRLGEKLLRPAAVVVSSGAAESSESANEKE